MDSDTLVLQPLNEIFTHIRRLPATEALGIVPFKCEACPRGAFQSFSGEVRGNTGMFAIKPSYFVVDRIHHFMNEGTWWCKSGEQHLFGDVFADVFREPRPAT